MKRRSRRNRSTPTAFMFVTDKADAGQEAWQQLKNWSGLNDIHFLVLPSVPLFFLKSGSAGVFKGDNMVVVRHQESCLSARMDYRRWSM